MIPVVDSTRSRVPGVQWSFWVACGLSVTAALAPVVITAGGVNRLSNLILPLVIAAVAMGVLAMEHPRGRTFAGAIYFVAGLVIVYGILSGVSLPLRLAVQGTCPAGPAACPAGLQPQMTSAEGTALSVAMTFAVLALLAGFVGLLILFRATARLLPAPPRPKPMEPVAPRPPATEPESGERAPEPTSKSPEPAVPAVTSAPATAEPEPPAFESEPRPSEPEASE
jgi:hypothetical protein